MSWKIVFSLVFFIVVVTLLVVYWFIPFDTTEFIISSGSQDNKFYNLSSESIQFYPNMRFTESGISYRIENCPLNKREHMVNAFQAIESLSLLKFYPVNLNEEIYVTCDSKTRIEGGLFIAGEGGPINITKSGEFNVIHNGKVLLLRDSNCENPNVGIHELLHVLGFDHVDNKSSIMYPVSNCDQEIDQSIIDILNSLYSIRSYPDLEYENVSAVMHGKYLNTNFTVKNNGLKDSGNFKIVIYADSKIVKEMDIDSLKIGNGRIISLTNVWVAKFNTNSIRFEIFYGGSELKKENNIAILQIK